MKKYVIAAIAVILLTALPLPVAAEEAENISAVTSYSGTGFDSFDFLRDGNSATFRTSSGNTSLRLDNSSGIGGLYLIFDLEYGVYTVTDNDTGITLQAGENSFLHDYLDLTKLFGAPLKSVTVSFENGLVRLSEVTVYSAGEPPASVQVWNPPLEGKADMVLFSAHGDDEQLFFAGLLPLYDRSYAVQVVYLTDHRNLTNQRTHEMLNGLWSVGIRAYPVFGPFEDFRLDDLDATYAHYEELGTSREALLSFAVEQIRRFRPQVAVTHDQNGEYGHGMHMLYADLLIQSLPITDDETVFPESAEKYGTWNIPKTYLHLYEENTVTIDIDSPLAEYGDMSAFQVTQEKGYPCHLSQQYTWFTRWLNGTETPITSASQIDTYNPAQYGLYRSTVGPDISGHDLMEHIVSYADQSKEPIQEVISIPQETEPVETQPDSTQPPAADPVPAQKSPVPSARLVCLVLLIVLVLPVIIRGYRK